MPKPAETRRSAGHPWPSPTMGSWWRWHP